MIDKETDRWTDTKIDGWIWDTGSNTQKQIQNSSIVISLALRDK